MKSQNPWTLPSMAVASFIYDPLARICKISDSNLSISKSFKTKYYPRKKLPKANFIFYFWGKIITSYKYFDNFTK